VDTQGKAIAASSKDLETRRAAFFASETAWRAAVEKLMDDRQQRFLHDQLRTALSANDVFVAYTSLRWLPPGEFDKVDVSSAIPPIALLAAWYGSRPQENLDLILAKMPADILQELRQAIPELYWQSDTRLAELRTALVKAGAKDTP
jgi:hypothetical protein